jgi:hypothetical protein
VLASEQRVACARIARAAANRRRILAHGPEIFYGDELLRATAVRTARGELARAIRRGLDVAGQHEVLDALLTADRELGCPEALALIDNAQRRPGLLQTLRELGRNRDDEDDSPSASGTPMSPTAVPERARGLAAE